MNRLPNEHDGEITPIEIDEKNLPELLAMLLRKALRAVDAATRFASHCHVADAWSLDGDYLQKQNDLMAASMHDCRTLWSIIRVLRAHQDRH